MKPFVDWSLRKWTLVLLLCAQVAGHALLFWNGERIAAETAASYLRSIQERLLPGLANAVALAVFEQDLEQLRRLLGPWTQSAGIVALSVRDTAGRPLFVGHNPQSSQAADAVPLTWPIGIGELRLGEMQILIDQAQIRAVARRSTFGAMALVGLGLTAGTLVLVLLALRVGRQLAALAEAARAIAGGNREVRAEPQGPWELRTLASAFNSMVDQLLDTNRRLEEEQKRLARSEQRFRDFANAASDWLWETDAEHRFVFLSHAADPTHPLQPQRFLGKRRQDLDFICDPESWRRHLEDLAHYRPFRNFRYQLADANGRLRTIEVSGVPQFDANGRFCGYRGVARDITPRIETEAQIRYLSAHDHLTGLANRPAFVEHLHRALSVARRDGSMLALHMVDLEGFRRINDTYGQLIGDAVLREMAERIRSEIRQGDLAARLAADEFAVLQPAVRSPTEAAALAERLLGRLQQLCELGEVRLRLRVTAGIALFPNDARDAESLLRHAAAALACGRAEGRTGFCFFEARMERAEQRRRQIEAALREVLEDGVGSGLALFLQPRVDLADGALIGAEALLRWRHGELGDISPAEFVPLAEQAGLVHALGSWVIDEACRLLSLMRHHLPPGFRLAVNLSPLQFGRRELVHNLRTALAKYAVEPTQLELEITETALMRDTRRAATQLTRIRQLGISLALDDFGTGYSSLGYLKRFAPDVVKIDRSFVMGLGKSPENEAIVRAVITLARSLGIRVVAEGVETAEQARFLLHEGCREGQGYLYAPALSPERFLREWLPSTPQPRRVVPAGQPNFGLPIPVNGD